MKYNRLLIIMPMLLMGLGACDDYLDEMPDKSGSAYIYHMDQLYGLMGSPDLYLFAGVESYHLSSGIINNYLSEPIILTDFVEYTPAFYTIGKNASYAETYGQYCWKFDELTKYSSSTWSAAWDRVYRFNTVLENLDKVVQTTSAIRDQVEGEARFGRAYYHFILLTQFCQWNEDAQGIGYRENTVAGEVPPRETVGYTLSHINEDLDMAEEALMRAGRTGFDLKHNYRPTVPTVQALRARIALYRGDYEVALANAEAALKAHNILVAFKDDPEYELVPYDEINLLDPTDTYVVETVTIYGMMNLENRRAEAVAEYEEFFLPAMSTGSSNPISESFYNLWDRENDARWIYFYSQCTPLYYTTDLLETRTLSGDEVPTMNCISYENQQWLKPWNWHSYMRFNCSRSGDILGMTTAEMYLTKAECLARAGQEGDAAEILKTLRRTRFMNQEAADAIGGTVQDVLDERAREMGVMWRYFDIKRLNGAENAGIELRRQILSDPTDINSVEELVIPAGDPRWAYPLFPNEIRLMGWEQNEGWE